MCAILDDDEDVLAGNTGERTSCTYALGREEPDLVVRVVRVVRQDSARKLPLTISLYSGKARRCSRQI
jgi:hypothetical protein